jgi:hypothetical protein
MRKKIILPFTTKLKGGSKKSFKLLNNKQINKSLINYIKEYFLVNTSEKSNKVNYIKGSESK